MSELIAISLDLQLFLLLLFHLFSWLLTLRLFWLLQIKSQFCSFRRTQVLKQLGFIGFVLGPGEPLSEIFQILRHLDGLEKLRI